MKKILGMMGIAAALFGEAMEDLSGELDSPAIDFNTGENSVNKSGNRNSSGKCSRHFDLKVQKNRMRNKMARKSRQINRKCSK